MFSVVLSTMYNLLWCEILKKEEKKGCKDLKSWNIITAINVGFFSKLLSCFSHGADRQGATHRLN